MPSSNHYINPSIESVSQRYIRGDMLQGSAKKHLYKAMVHYHNERTHVHGITYAVTDTYIPKCLYLHTFIYNVVGKAAVVKEAAVEGLGCFGGKGERGGYSTCYGSGSS